MRKIIYSIIALAFVAGAALPAEAKCSLHRFKKASTINFCQRACKQGQLRACCACNGGVYIQGHCEF